MKNFLFNFLKKLALLSLTILPQINLHAGTYNTSTGELFLPHLIVGEKHLTEVLIKLNPDGTYAIQHGTESALPFRCKENFVLATENLVKTAKNLSEMEALLGCRWASTGHFISSNEFVPLDFTTYAWIDSRCQGLTVVTDTLTEEIESIDMTLNVAGCNIFNSIGLYDLKNNLTFIQYVRVDNTVVATDVFIRFSPNNRYELVNYTLWPDTNPQYVCNSLTEEKFDLVDSNMSVAQINQILGCVPFSEHYGDGATKYVTWKDHEWNDIIIGSDQKSFNQLKVGTVP